MKRKKNLQEKKYFQKNVLKAGEKQYLTHKGKTIRMTANFTSETTKAKRKRHDVFQVLKGENCQTGILHPTKVSCSSEEEIKTFSDKNLPQDLP